MHTTANFTKNASRINHNDIRSSGFSFCSPQGFSSLLGFFPLKSRTKATLYWNSFLLLTENGFLDFSGRASAIRKRIGDSE
ncbi:LOW QUALITY PROTEIN: hypothetical protein PanWU01x14_322910 [Parasponia andersonii]|uniref:Uncharacterized protein n=1 Tax=Parasponia andersonii TaxID=3476 RepID=A0A2P5AKM6_PARAD|nr:LOW QUALITY PROTEIN: hypothetical protein PanWU01x14_322910 [Parasponia andersonii]